MRRFAILAAALLLALPTVLPAGEDADRPKKKSPQKSEADRTALFGRLDANSDGFVTEDEVGDKQRRLFKRLQRTSDENKDGKLSAAEFVAGLKNKRPKRPLEQVDRAGGRADFRKRGPEQMFKRLDTNKDGKVVADEVPEQFKARFERILKQADKDADQTVTMAEFKAHIEKHLKDARARIRPAGGGIFGALDSDKDGKLSTGEIAAAAQALQKLDKNSDGEITRQELMPAAFAQRAAGGAFMIARLMKHDANKDGKLTKDELPEQLQKRFKNFDTNADGAVTEAELKEKFSKQRKFRGKDARKKKKRNKPGQKKPDKKSTDASGNEKSA